jgi:hypothetical protein
MANIINAITTGAGGLSTTADASGSIQIATNNGTTAMTIDTSQNVGIGTASPAQKLDILGNASVNRSTATAYNLGGGIKFQVDGISYAAIAQPSAQALAFYTGNDTTERMRITSGGTVGINCTPSLSMLQTTVPSGGNVLAARFQHPGNTTFGTVMSIETTAGTDNPSVSWKHNNGGSPVYYGINLASNGTIYFNTAANEAGFGTQRISFDASGNAYKGSGAGSWLSLSDERIKTNIEDVTGGLSRILQLRPRTFDYKQPDAHNGKIHEKGFIAQEMETVYPNSITETDFILEQDKQYFAEGEKAKAIGFNSEFYADLVKAIQEQQTIINDLKARITALEGAA